MLTRNLNRNKDLCVMNLFWLYSNYILWWLAALWGTSSVLLHGYICYSLKQLPIFISLCLITVECLSCGKWCMLEHDEVQGTELEQDSLMNGHLKSEMDWRGSNVNIEAPLLHCGCCLLLHTRSAGTQLPSEATDCNSEKLESAVDCLIGYFLVVIAMHCTSHDANYSY